MTDASSSMIPTRKDGVAWVTVDGDVVAVDEADKSHVIRSPGSLLWPLLEGETTADELATDVADVFGIELDVAEADVERFLADMVRLGLVDVATSGPAEAG